MWVSLLAFGDLSLQHRFSEGPIFCQRAGCEAWHGGAGLYPQLLRGLRKHGHEFQASLGSTVKHAQTDTSNQPLLLLGCAGEQFSRRAPAWQTQSPLLHLAPRTSYVECSEQQCSQGPEVPSTANGEGTGVGSAAMFLISGEKFSPVSAVFDIWFTIHFFSKLEIFSLYFYFSEFFFFFKKS